MDITFLGHSSFKIRGKNATLVTDPYDPTMVGLKYPSVSADIVTVSHAHQDHNMIAKVTDVRKVVGGPGEYEITGVSIIGISTYHDDKKGELRGKNTVYVIEMDSIRLLHLGDLGHKLSSEILEEIGSIDILMVPIGGEYTIGSSQAVGVVQDIEPKLVLPMHYQMQGLNPEVFSKLESLDTFLKEVGLPVEKIDKLSIKKSEIGEEQKVVVLEKM